MVYWISTDDIQTGPYSLEQLQMMWEQGTVTSNAFYYDALRSEWLRVQALVENSRDLFSVEEAFVRLGQNRQRGCLSVYNDDETVQIYVEGGFVICALADEDHGELALSRALKLENARYEWLFDSRPATENVRLNIAEYSLKHAIARDVRIANTATRKHHTVSIPKGILDKVEVKIKFNFVLVPEETPLLPRKLEKVTNVVGREPHCDVQIDNRQVSRKHCLLEVTEEHVKVKDLDSSNGTLINGTAIRDGILNDGDVLNLGTYKLTLRKEQKKAPQIG